MPAIGESPSVPNLLELVSHAYVLEILDALNRGPMTLADLSTHVHARRRGLAAALRVVGARGLVTRDNNGSWDNDAPVGAVYRHTDLGRVVVEALSCFGLWTAMYDHVDTTKAHSWNR
jgi:DNA-binding HxlR family transcriptional regulator